MQYINYSIKMVVFHVVYQYQLPLVIQFLDHYFTATSCEVCRMYLCLNNFTALLTAKQTLNFPVQELEADIDIWAAKPPGH